MFFTFEVIDVYDGRIAAYCIPVYLYTYMTSQLYKLIMYQETDIPCMQWYMNIPVHIFIYLYVFQRSSPLPRPQAPQASGLRPSSVACNHEELKLLRPNARR